MTSNRHTLKYYPRLNMYKAANVTYNPSTGTATSYDWWHFVIVIKGKVVFNRHAYSVTTTRHQSKVRNVLNDLGIKIDLEIDSRKSLSDCYVFDDAIAKLNVEIQLLKAEINKPLSREKTNLERARRIKLKVAEIKQIRQFQKNYAGRVYTNA